ncbi:hypothetical protein KAR34_13340, partial [bacterium]|nr:hypothetical protein [bacterium]
HFLSIMPIAPTQSKYAYQMHFCAKLYINPNQESFAHKTQRLYLTKNEKGVEWSGVAEIWRGG